MCEFVNYKTVV